MNEPIDCRRCRVSGRVQGVFYRASTERRATDLGLAGYVRNCADGTVEVVMHGPVAACDDLEAWLWEGPPSARVEAVQCETESEPPTGTGFTTR